MKKSTKRKLGPAVYGTFIIVYVIFLLIVVMAILGKTWKFAVDYEAALPEPVIKAYIAELNENKYNEALGETIASMQHDVQSDEQVAEAVKYLLNGEITYSRAGGSDGDNSIKYDLVCGTNKFGDVELVRDDNAGKDANFVVPVFKWGFDLRPWKIGQQNFYLDGLYSSAGITVPETYTVKVNDITLDESYIVQRDIPYDVLEKYYDDYPGLPTKVSYRLDDFIGHMDMKVYDEHGNEVNIDDSKDDWQYIEQPSDEEMASLGAYVSDFADKYLYFSSGVGNPNGAYAALKPFIVEGSDLDQHLKAALANYAEGWLNTNSYQFNGATVNSAMNVGAGYYLLDVTAETTVTFPNKGENGVVHDAIGLNMVVHSDGSSYKVISVTTY